MTFRKALAALVGAAMVLTPAAPGGAQDEPSAPDQDNDTVIVTGHGWGHGRGMGQYGSLGYSIDLGWTSEQILDHYYGATTAGTVEDELLTVRLESASDQPTVAAVDSGALVLLDGIGTVTHIGLGGAIRLTGTPDGFVIADAPSCAGPFVDRPGVVASEEIRISSASTQPSGGVHPVPTTATSTVVVGDWDGDGSDDLGLVDAGTWSLWHDGPDTTSSVPDHTFVFGDESTTPLVGDWDGDGIDEPAHFAAGGTWTLRDGFGTEAGTTTFAWGVQEGDVPIVGDWDGDGDHDEGVRRNDRWLLRSTDGEGTITHNFSYGQAADVPIVGDWDGDGVDDPGFVRGANVRRQLGLSATGVTLDQLRVGPRGSTRVAGDWDGDGVDHVGFVGNGIVDLTGPLLGLIPRVHPDIELEETIQRCESASVQRYYRGELRAVANDGNQRTVNAVPVEAYLRSVVPLEMPAGWAQLEGGAGAHAVRVQAVSARSYSLAENRTSYARTCDTISCQVYAGRAVRIDGELITNENPLSDQAIVDTAGVVRMRGGEVARTEFSSSTGGWTAGGVFPAVEDAGDSVSRNPNHDWARAIAVADIEARFSGRTLDRAVVTERNGLGQDGGRVLTVELTFGEEVFTMTGNEFRRAFGLKSDWFTIDWERFVQRTDCICPEVWPEHGLDDRFAAGG